MSDEQAAAEPTDAIGIANAGDDQANGLDGIEAATQALRAARMAMEDEETTFSAKNPKSAKAAKAPKVAKEVKAAAAEPAPVPEPEQEEAASESEPPAVEKPAPGDGTDQEKVPERLAKSWANISRKEAQLRTQQQQFKEQMSQMETQRKELQETLARVEGAKKDPIGYLDKELGRKWYQDATERFINDGVSGKPTTEQQVAMLQQQITEEREAREKWFEERWKSKESERDQQKSNEAQAHRYMSDVESLVKSDDRFELTRLSPDGVDAVRELVVGYLKEHNQLLTPEQAATLVEQELEARADALFKAQKLRAKYQATKTEPPEAKPRSKTLTTNLASNGTSAGDMSPDQRVALAVQQLRQHRTQRGDA